VDKKSIAIVAVLAILIIFYWPILEFLGFVKPQERKAADTAATDTVAVAQPAAGQSGQVPKSPLDVTPGAPVALAATVAAFPQSDTSLKVDTIVIHTNKYDMVLSSLGGGPTSLKLKDYAYRSGEPIQMLVDAQRVTPECRFAGGTFSSSQLNYTCNLTPGTYEVTSAPLAVVYTYTAGDGYTIERKLIFYPDQHHFDLTLTIPNPARFGFERSYDLVWNTPLQPTEPQVKDDYAAMEVVAMQGGSRDRLGDFEDGVLNQRAEGDATWAGVRSKYFTAVMIPQSRHADGVMGQGDVLTVDTETGMLDRRRLIGGLEMPFSSLNPIADSFTVFVGPLDYLMMADYDVDMQAMLDIGTMPVVGWIIKPFAIGVLWLLPKMYQVVPNYGLVILLFALLVKLVTLPLSLKSFKSMQAMKEVQPKLDELKEKYKKDAAKLNQEMMKLYKQHGVNPLSGCLVMLPQMPLVIALFSVFRATILLRDAPFVWFINDLSRGAQTYTDPYMILVLLMIASQFVSQKLTMTATQQNKIFLYVLPVIIGFMFRTVASGLVLYWTSFSLLSMLDYAIFRRGSKNPEVKAA
jgi:YidC/Oxa1 family membrane protein insertase